MDGGAATAAKPSTAAASAVKLGRPRAGSLMPPPLPAGLIAHGSTSPPPRVTPENYASCRPVVQGRDGQRLVPDRRRPFSGPSVAACQLIGHGVERGAPLAPHDLETGRLLGV